MKIKYPKSIKVPEWWKPGNGMMYNRDCLPISHPECTYNYIKNVLGYPPEIYGCYHPVVEKYKDYPKEQLLSTVCELQTHIISMDV